MLVILIKGFCVFVAITELSYALFRKKYIFLVAYNLKKEFYAKQKKIFSDVFILSVLFFLTSTFVGAERFNAPFANQRLNLT